ESPATTASLFVRIRDQHDTGVWGDLLEIYAPAVYAFGRRSGLGDVDAADFMRGVMQAVASTPGPGGGGPGRGPFRRWVYSIARDQVAAFLGDGRAPVADSAEEWERDSGRRLAAWAMDRIRGEFPEATWRAFRMTAVEGQDAGRVASELGLSAGAV